LTPFGINLLYGFLKHAVATRKKFSFFILFFFLLRALKVAVASTALKGSRAAR